MSCSLEKAKIRFHPKVNKTESCWLWVGAKNGNGYGLFLFEGKMRLAHRVSWILTNGAIRGPRNCVLHKCDNPPCVNPSHLFLGSMADNAKDRDQKGRTARMYGEASKITKLTERDIYLIDKFYAEYPNTTTIARIFGVDRRTIARIVSGESWPNARLRKIGVEMGET